MRKILIGLFAVIALCLSVKPVQAQNTYYPGFSIWLDGVYWNVGPKYTYVDGYSSIDYAWVTNYSVVGNIEWLAFFSNDDQYTLSRPYACGVASETWSLANHTKLNAWHPVPKPAPLPPQPPSNTPVAAPGDPQGPSGQPATSIDVNVDPDPTFPLPLPPEDGPTGPAAMIVPHWVLGSKGQDSFGSTHTYFYQFARDEDGNFSLLLFTDATYSNLYFMTQVSFYY